MNSSILVKVCAGIGCVLGIMFALWLTEPDPVNCNTTAVEPTIDYLDTEYYSEVANVEDLCPTDLNAVSLVDSRDEQGNFVLVLGAEERLLVLTKILPFRHKMHYCDIAY